jgi:uncharacterized protein YkwD
MVSRDYFSHSSPGGESYASRLISFGFSPSGCSSWTVGEDIGYGIGSHGSAMAIFEAWMHSPPHRAVILTRRFRSVGVGCAVGRYRGVPDVVFFTLDCGARSS